MGLNAERIFSTGAGVGAFSELEELNWRGAGEQAAPVAASVAITRKRDNLLFMENPFDVRMNGVCRS
jgi:hypothetical protein